MVPLKFSADPFFPAKDYTSACKVNRPLTITYLVARDQKMATIIQQIEVLNKNHHDWRHPQNPWHLTPLHVAVWRLNLEAVQYFLAQNCDPLAKDALGFLPIDYAEALCAQSIIETLQGATKVRSVSHRILWDALLKRPEIDASETVFSYETDKNAVVMGNSACFTQMTDGAIFTPTIFFRNREALLNMIADELRGSLERIHFFHYNPQIIEALSTEPIPLRLKQQGDAGLGVVASKKLEPFLPVVIYGGEAVTLKDHEKSALSGAYTLKPFEAHRYRNLGGMINDGFPNCAIDSIHHPSGIAYPVIVPLRTIEEGEELFVDYQKGHSVKKLKRIEFNLAEAYAFLAEKSLHARVVEDLFPLMQAVGKLQNTLEPEKLLEYITLLTKVNYLIGTPTLLFALLLEGRISVEDLEFIGSRKELLPLFDHQAELQGSLLKMVQVFQTMDLATEKAGWDVKKEVQDILHELSLQYNAETVSAALMYLHNQLNVTLSMPAKMPRGILKNMYLKSFMQAVNHFEITRACLNEIRDATPEELKFLETIKDQDPYIELIYLTFYGGIQSDRFPNLHGLIQRRKIAAQEKPNPQSQMQGLIRSMRSMAPQGLPPQIEGLLQAMQSNPELPQAFLGLLQNQMKK
jgi:hypothetical protein